MTPFRLGLSNTTTNAPITNSGSPVTDKKKVSQVTPLSPHILVVEMSHPTPTGPVLSWGDLCDEGLVGSIRVRIAPNQPILVSHTDRNNYPPVDNGTTSRTPVFFPSFPSFINLPQSVHTRKPTPLPQWTVESRRVRDGRIPTINTSCRY